MTGSQQPALDVARLQRQISDRVGGLPITLHYHHSCGSTNAECMKISQNGAVVIAEQQTAGRGRRGNHWHSPDANNIYCSIGVHKAIVAERLGLVSLQVGVSTATVLQGLGFEEVSLKWPNDILLHGRKLGGILIETRALAADEFFLVIGLGLNTTPQREVLSALDRPAISLAEVAEQPLDRHSILLPLVSEIIRSVNLLDRHNMESLCEEFMRLDAFFGQQVNVHTRSETLSGWYRGLDETGHIQVQTDLGLKTFSAAEISLRAVEHAADR